jgi:hypothetical protein
MTTETRRRRVAVPALLLAFATALGAAEPETRVVQVSASVVGTDRTPEQARHEALARAREQAVAEAAGIRVAAQQLRMRAELDGAGSDAFSFLVQTSTEGRIVREQVSYHTRLEGETPVYEATLVAEVALEEGERDPGFTLDLTTEPDTNVYRDGELLAVEVTASRPCYLTLIRVGSDGTLDVLLPNRFRPARPLEAGHAVKIPADSDRFALRARLPAGREIEHERLLAVATLDPIAFDLARTEGEELSRDSTQTSSLTALNRWLLTIPVARRAEALWEYEIRR